MTEYDSKLVAADHASAPENGKVLVIKGKGGLGNRMLSAITGLVYADLSGRTPIIDWRDGVYAPLGTNAYPLIFDGPPQPDPGHYDDAMDVAPDIWSGKIGMDTYELVERIDPSKHASHSFYRKTAVDLSRLDWANKVAVFWSYLPKLQRLRTHLRRSERYAGRSSDHISAEALATYFTPNRQVRDAVATFLTDLPRPLIGVHIRYTDRKMPLAPFRNALRAELDRRPGAGIFLATDSAQVQAEFEKEFGKIHYIDKHFVASGARLHSPATQLDKQREAENALIDMWALSRCDHLIYSKNSTFSVCSALIGDLTARQQTDVDRYNPKIVIKRLVQPYL